jgi:hypothetical protein
VSKYCVISLVKFILVKLPTNFLTLVDTQSVRTFIAENKRFRYSSRSSESNKCLLSIKLMCKLFLSQI